MKFPSSETSLKKHDVEQTSASGKFNLLAPMHLSARLTTCGGTVSLIIGTFANRILLITVPFNFVCRRINVAKRLRIVRAVLLDVVVFSASRMDISTSLNRQNMSTAAADSSSSQRKPTSRNDNTFHSSNSSVRGWLSKRNASVVWPHTGWFSL